MWADFDAVGAFLEAFFGLGRLKPHTSDGPQNNSSTSSPGEPKHVREVLCFALRSELCASPVAGRFFSSGPCLGATPWCAAEALESPVAEADGGGRFGGGALVSLGGADSADAAGMLPIFCACAENHLLVRSFFH